MYCEKSFCGIENLVVIIKVKWCWVRLDIKESRVQFIFPSCISGGILHLSPMYYLFYSNISNSEQTYVCSVTLNTDVQTILRTRIILAEGNRQKSLT